jgi:hypothetical protein
VWKDDTWKTWTAIIRYSIAYVITFLYSISVFQAIKLADDNILARLKRDNVTAQRVQCGKCGLPMAQSKGGISDKNLVAVKNKKTTDNKPAKGLMCGTCLEDPRFKEEGPRNAVILDEASGDIRPVYYDNLLDSATVKEKQAEEEPTKSVKRGR